MKVFWNKKASNELEDIYKYIKKESPQNAILVFNEIYDLSNFLPNYLYKFPVEPIINIEKVRFAAIWSFKIVYSIEKESIVILRVFNTKQNPKKLKK
jgi:plasmid stabilization system protein ParE